MSTHIKGRHCNQIDHFGIGKRYSNSIRNVKTCRGADVSSDSPLLTESGFRNKKLIGKRGRQRIKNKCNMQELLKPPPKHNMKK